MDENKIEEVVDASATTEEMGVSTTEKPKVKTSLIGRLNNYLTSLKRLEGLIEQTQPKRDTLMGSRFMKNRLRHQIEDLQRSLERYIGQLEQEQEA
jgi:hypothetical protein